MKKIFVFIFIFFIVGAAFSQSITSRVITWSSSTSTELHSNVNIDHHCTLITRSDNQIDFVIEGNSALIFSVNSIDGNWSDPNVNGSLTYHISFQGRPGVVIIERTDFGISAVIDFTETASDALKQKIIIDHVE